MDFEEIQCDYLEKEIFDNIKENTIVYTEEFTYMIFPEYKLVITECYDRFAPVERYYYSYEEFIKENFEEEEEK